MNRLIICGQAPSRQGDGRPFSGPSGRRLATLMGLKDYEELASRVKLTNIFDHTAEPSRASHDPNPWRLDLRTHHAGDKFDEERARTLGLAMVFGWKAIAASDPPVVVLGCGGKVFRALTGQKKPMFKGTKVAPGVHVWHFPHPSGASHFWNDPASFDRASGFLKRLQDRYGMPIAE